MDSPRPGAICSARIATFVRGRTTGRTMPMQMSCAGAKRYAEPNGGKAAVRCGAASLMRLPCYPTARPVKSSSDAEAHSRRSASAVRARCARCGGALAALLPWRRVGPLRGRQVRADALRPGPGRVQPRAAIDGRYRLRRPTRPKPKRLHARDDTSRPRRPGTRPGTSPAKARGNSRSGSNEPRRVPALPRGARHRSMGLAPGRLQSGDLFASAERLDRERAVRAGATVHEIDDEENRTRGAGRQ